MKRDIYIQILNILPQFVFLINLYRFENIKYRITIYCLIPFLILLGLKIIKINTINYDLLYTLYIIWFHYFNIIKRNKKFLINTYIGIYIIEILYTNNIKKECNICMNYVRIMKHNNSKMNSSCHTCNLLLCVNCFNNLTKNVKCATCPICRKIIFSEIFN